MCGLVVLARRSSPVSEQNLRRMTGTLQHRGPDDRGYRIEDGVGLGHRRLSILDLSPCGRQPFVTEGGDVASIVNGEIYNHQSLRGGLRAGGHRFESTSDSEVVGHQFEEHGEGFVESLDGMFALAVHDRSSGRVVLARDPFGIKPLYYYRDEELFAAASEIKALLEHPRIEPREATDYLPLYFHLGFMPSPRTLFQGIRSLRPGEHVVLDTRDWSLRQETYYQLPPPKGSEVEPLVGQVRADLRASVRKRLMSDVGVGVLLSGGLDSTILASLAQESLEGTLDTFTVTFETAGADEKYDQDRRYARQVAEALGTNHHQFPIRDQDPLGTLLEDAIYHMDQPDYDPTTLTRHRMYRAIAEQGGKVVLSGGGADEIFGGYSRLRYTQWEEWMRRWIPGPIRRAGEFVGGDRFRRANRRLSQPSWQRYASWYQHYPVEAFADVFTEPFRRSMRWGRGESLLRSSLEPDDSRDPVEYVGRSDLRTWMPDEFLLQIDRTSMARGLEVRVPYLDRDLVDRVMAVPFRAKLGVWNPEKWILREAFRGRIPGEIVERTKQGLNSPGSRWLKEGLRPALRRWLDSDELSREGRFRPEVVERWRRQHREGEAYRFHHLWRLLCYRIWRSIFSVRDG